MAQNKKNDDVETFDPELEGFRALLPREDLEDADVSEAGIRDVLASLGISEEDAAFTASGFRRVEKDELVDVPLFILQWEKKPSTQYGGMYTVVLAVNKENEEKVVFADGGTGISRQLDAVSRKRIEKGFPPAAFYQGLDVPGGLVKSEYDSHENREGQMIPAGATFYLG